MTKPLIRECLITFCFLICSLKIKVQSGMVGGNIGYSYVGGSYCSWQPPFCDSSVYRLYLNLYFDSPYTRPDFVRSSLFDLDSGRLCAFNMQPIQDSFDVREDIGCVLVIAPSYRRRYSYVWTIDLRNQSTLGYTGVFQGEDRADGYVNILNGQNYGWTYSINIPSPRIRDNFGWGF